MCIDRISAGLAILCLSAFLVQARANGEDLRRLYDLTPVSATNPVVAEVKDCDIEIPVSEFAGFIRTHTPPNRYGRQLTADEKRRALDGVIDDHFWVWYGYAHHADQNSDIQEMLAVTRDEAMKALLLKAEANDRADSLPDYERLKQQLEQRLFDQAEIHIQKHAYDVLLAAANRVNLADQAATNAMAAPPDGLSAAERNLPLAVSKAATVPVGPFLDAYRQLPVAERPDLAKHEVVEALLRSALTDSLMLAEARRRGLDKDKAVREQVQSDCTGLVRMWALDQVTRQTVEAMQQPGVELKVRQWYDAHLKSLYTIRDKDGNTRVMDFKTNYAIIKDDCFNGLQEQLRAERLRQFRAGHPVRIDEKRLAGLALNWWEPVEVAELAPPLVSWDADTREYAVKPGETNATFSFTVTNNAPVELVLEDIFPVNEFITVTAPVPPLKLNPGEHGEVRVNVDLRNKRGIGHSPIHVMSSLGSKTLMLTLIYPDPAGTESGRKALPAQPAGNSSRLP